MSRVSEVYEQYILLHITGQLQANSNSILGASLHTSDPGDTGANEVSDTGYSKQDTEFNVAVEVEDGPSYVENSETISWNFDSPHLLTHVGFWDANNDFVWSCPFETNKSVSGGGGLFINSEALRIELD